MHNGPDFLSLLTMSLNTLGIRLLIPLFNQNQAGRAHAKAEVARAAWSCIGSQRTVRLEVREAHARYVQAAEALAYWHEELVPSLEALVRGSAKAFELGELSPLALQDNTRQLVTARVREVELEADLRQAWAELERSVGTRLQPEVSP